MTNGNLDLFQSTRFPRCRPARQKVIGVYKITCEANGQFYIGCTSNMRRRFRSHITDLQNGRHSCGPMQEDFTKYGEADFAFAVVSVCSNIQAARHIEQDMIVESRDNPASYNRAIPGGCSSAIKKAPSISARIRPNRDDRSYKLKQWMKEKRKGAQNLAEAILRSKRRACEVLSGSMPSDSEIQKIRQWTHGQITARDFFIGNSTARPA